MFKIISPGLKRRLTVVGLAALMVMFGLSGLVAAEGEPAQPPEQGVPAKKLLGKPVKYSAAFSPPTVFPAAPQKNSPEKHKPGAAVSAGGDSDDNTSFFFDMQRDVEVDMETWQGQAGLQIDF